MNFRYAIPGYIAKFDVRDARNIRFDVNIVSNFIGRFGRLSIVIHTLRTSDNQAPAHFQT